MSVDPNRHVREYLQYYVSKQRPPNYAVLVEGPWGIGKTFLVRKTLDNLPKVQLPNVPYPWRAHQESEATSRARRWVHISLFGIKSAEELDVAILRALYPMLRDSRAQLIGSLATGLLRALRYNPAIQLTEVLTKFRPGTYVFDDLERCEMPLRSVLGYINQFVEHRDCRVVIIASEKEIADQKQIADPKQSIESKQSTDQKKLPSEEYRRQKEKIIGKTLVVQMEFDEALAEFIAHVEDDNSRQLFRDCSDTIALVFRQSGLGTLRILQQTIWDFERILPALSEEDRANKEAFDVFLRLFFALSFELKSGRLGADDLVGRPQKVVAEMMLEHRGGPAGELAQADRRYPDFSLSGSSALSDETLVDILVKGIVDIDAIRASIASSGHFATRLEPAWRTVWHFTERSDDEFSAALQTMERQFNQLEFRIPGEMLHVFGLRLWLADQGAIGKTREQARHEAIAYIDKLLGRGELEPVLPDMRDDDPIEDDAFGGLMFVQAGSEDFKQIYKHLREMRTVAGQNKLPALAEALLSELEAAPRLFVRRLVWNEAGDTKYASVPILAVIEPDRFAEIVLRQPIGHQRTILSAFKSRYGMGELDTKLAAERSWLAAVRDALVQRTANAPMATRLRIQRFITWYFAPHLT